ncbi:acetate/propionate family kinase [Microbacteriaceae bacterium]|nr:acetate/propionate family kinase [Candidatus Saccharibacteria bacterium]
METANNSQDLLLTVNAGSSSIKLAVFSADDLSSQSYEVEINNINQPSARLMVGEVTELVDAKDHASALKILMNRLSEQIQTTQITAVGHRMVHGGPNYHETQIITKELLDDLQSDVSFDPLHLPIELGLIDVFYKLLPDANQFVCFDTAFHHDLPTTARLLPIPRHLSDKGIRRYGFHGLSYQFILSELKRVEGEVASNGKVIIAHLGSGASLAALYQGKSVDTTMGMSSSSGIPMSTRSGDLDPGLVFYLAQNEGYNVDQFDTMVKFESGLLGISETTADMEKLLQIESSDERAKDAVDIFCYYVTKSIGALAAALGGLDTLVFTGGMGENAPIIRARVCKNLEFLGITIDESRNQNGERLISAEGSRVGTHVIHTDESITIAREISKLIYSK